MRLSRFFIDRPIFAAVLAVIITIVGAVAYIGLPVSQYPDIVPPTVTVTATYPGASAETVAETVAAPIEQEINGVDNMLYMSSQSTGDGNVTITVTFKTGTDLDAAQVLVQNRVAIATPRLPETVQRLGVVTRKTSPDFLMVVNLVSPDKSLDRAYISNYALTQLRDRLSRIDGVGDVRLFGSRDYAMRVWIDPGRAAALDLTAGESVAAPRRSSQARRAAARRMSWLYSAARRTSRDRVASPSPCHHSIWGAAASIIERSACAASRNSASPSGPLSGAAGRS